MAECNHQFPEHVRQLYHINYGYLVRVRVWFGLGLGRVMVRVRIRLGIGLGLGFCSGQSQCVPLFRFVNYHILVKSGTRCSRSVPPFRKLYQPFLSARICSPVLGTRHRCRKKTGAGDSLFARLNNTITMPTLMKI